MEGRLAAFGRFPGPDATRSGKTSCEAWRTTRAGGRENADVAGSASDEVAVALVRIAVASYAANCLLGIAVATKAVRLGRARWLHHALYIGTSATAAAAASTALWARSLPGAALVPALLPLALVPYRSRTVRRHVVAATAAAPAYLAALAALPSRGDR
jgi:hypothetical protein